MKSELKQLLDNIDQLMAEVNEYMPLKPEQEQRLMQKMRLDWNYHSSHIEGNTLTYGETKALLFWGITAGEKPIKDIIEMRGHDKVVQNIYEIVKEKNRPLTEQFIREMHEIILGEPYEIDAITLDGKPTKKRVEPGRYKQLPNHVRTKDGSIFYFATPEETPAKMKDLMDWFRKNDSKEHPLITAAAYHYQFVRIHPFDDGNGRMARILMNFILMMHGFPPAIIHTEKRENYLLALTYADAGDLEKFIEYIGEQETASLELVLKAAKGEPIEDEEDIDKMIDSIKKKLV
jgi:Fic family protein